MPQLTSINLAQFTPVAGGGPAGQGHVHQLALAVEWPGPGVAYYHSYHPAPSPPPGPRGRASVAGLLMLAPGRCRAPLGAGACTGKCPAGGARSAGVTPGPSPDRSSHCGGCSAAGTARPQRGSDAGPRARGPARRGGSGDSGTILAGRSPGRASGGPRLLGVQARCLDSSCQEAGFTGNVIHGAWALSRCSRCVLPVRAVPAHPTGGTS